MWFNNITYPIRARFWIRFPWMGKEPFGTGPAVVVIQLSSLSDDQTDGFNYLLY
jgi:hypothetical protein